CDGALSKRFEFDDTGTGSDLGALVSGLRYEYDGLNLLRVDEIYGASLSESGPWRTVEVSTHRPGQLSALLHKRVYEYYPANNTASPDETHDFTYAHDPVGNVLSVFDNSGNEQFYFAQDAFGNELPINSAFGASDWGTAAGEDYRITEHQTGKWMDVFTGLYYFHARWYDSEVGRFLSRDPIREIGGNIYGISGNNPPKITDPTGRWRCGGPGCTPPPGWEPEPPQPPTGGERCINAKGGCFSSRYGNYCGGGTPSDPDYIASCPPIDDMDRCCFRHDQCYGEDDIDWDFNKPFPWMQRFRCDTALCVCVTRAKMPGFRASCYRSNMKLLFDCCPKRSRIDLYD
ncbi:MAG: hypothetical protein KC994_25650, partial [Candidatus Omnitrophica bacterium]|nr:hypothetical protein [Candidatus Omnitrophota bacterium]